MQSSRTRPRRFCSDACRQASYRERKRQKERFQRRVRLAAAYDHLLNEINGASNANSLNVALDAFISLTDLDGQLRRHMADGPSYITSEARS